MPIQLNPPTRWPAMPVGAHDFPKSLDRSAESHVSKGSNSGGAAKRNKAGRTGCAHAATSHGPCGCVSKEVRRGK